jgi:hypothetical protein
MRSRKAVAAPPDAPLLPLSSQLALRRMPLRGGRGKALRLAKAGKSGNKPFSDAAQLSTAGAANSGYEEIA